jgi:hypothetical protein
MPNANKTLKNRTNELKRIKSQATTKQNFKLILPKTIIPGQQIQLFTKNLKNNYQGISFKEADPKGYIKQKLMLQVEKNKATRKYNKPKKNTGTRRKSNMISMANLLEQWESGGIRG